MNDYLFLPGNFPPEGFEPPRKEGNQRETDWGMLCRGKTLGKRVNIDYSNVIFGDQTNNLNILEVGGADEFALQLSIQISPPRIYRNVIPAGANVAQVAGSEDNVDLLTSGIDFANPFVTVEWGIGGVSNKVECDCLNGLHLNLAASWVRVGAAVQAPQLNTDSRVYELSAFVGPGRPRDNNAQKTINVPIINAAIGDESSRIAIPRYAKTVYLAGSNSVNATFVGNMRFYRNGTGSFSVCEYVFSANQPTPFPIPLGAYYFTTVNGIVNPQHQAIFNLSV